MRISKQQQSILAIAAGLLIFAWAKHSYILLGAAGVIALTYPFALLNIPIHQTWMWLSKILGWISSHLILTILFYMVLTPVSFLRRIFRKKEKNAIGKTRTSNFHLRNHEFTPTDLTNPW